MRVCNGSWRHGQKRELRGTLNVNESQAPCSHAAEKVIGQESPTIASLPTGVLAHIFEGLGPRDLASASCVCRAWRHLVALEAAANLVWRSFYSARWQLSSVYWPQQPSSPQRPQLPQRRTDAVAIPDAGPHSDTTSFSSPSSSLSCSPPEMRWQWAYGSKMLRLRSWSGRYSADQVVGHKSAVRAVRLLPSLNLLATASLDRTVRLWDLAAGMPLARSRPHGGTVRCLALDTSILASGCSDNLVRVWHRRDPGTTALPLYDISSKPYLLRGHTGPVSCLALDEVSPAYGTAGRLRGLAGRGGGGALGSGTIFSGSWDCTVRIWRQSDADGGGYGEDESEDVDGLEISDEDGSDGVSASRDVRRGGGHTSDEGGSSSSGAVGTTAAAAPVSAATRRARRPGSPDTGEAGGWSCAGVLQYGDWVYCCAVRGGNLLVAAGSEVVVTDAATGRAVRRFAGLHDGSTVACLEGCRSGRLLFTASADGLLLAHDLRMKQGSRVLWHHNAAVTGLAFEDPWLASSAADGCIILQDSEQALAGGCGPQRALNASCRALHCPTSQPALSLDLSDQWLAAGTESGVVRLWDFTGAAAAAERAAAARVARSAAKAARAHAGGRQHHPQQQPPQPPPPPPPPRHPQQLQQLRQQHRPKHAQCEVAPPPAAGGSQGSTEAGMVGVAGGGGVTAAAVGTASGAGGEGPHWHPDGAPEVPKAGGRATSLPLPPPPSQRESDPSGAARDNGQQRSAGATGAGGSASHRRRRRQGSGGGGHAAHPNPFHHYHSQNQHQQPFAQQYVTRARGSSAVSAFRYVGAGLAGGRQLALPPPLPPR